MCIKQEISVETMYSAPVLMALSTFCSAMAVEMASNFTANVPPNPQQVSQSSTSINSRPCTFFNKVRGLSLIPHSLSAPQAS